MKDVGDSIQHERLAGDLPDPLRESFSREILPGEIDGFRTLCHVVVPGDTVALTPAATTGRALLFTAGCGRAEVGSNSWEIGEIALLVPSHLQPVSVTATDAPLRFLELLLDLSPTDREELVDNADKLPFFISYAQCPTYRERIKSEKTVSRTLLPEHTYPRLCIGSVETTGDDRVAAHEHPMLEQLFYGLQGNDCLMQADEVQLGFGEDVLVHIPLGSRHGVEVSAPNRLHYIWIDVFRDRSGMDWIVREHIPEP